MLHFYEVRNYKGCIKLGIQISKRLEDTKVDDHHIHQIHLRLQLLTGQTKIFDGEYSAGLSEIGKVLNEMLKDPDNFQDDLATACFYFVWHPGYAEQCYNISARVRAYIAGLLNYAYASTPPYNLSAEVPPTYKQEQESIIVSPTSTTPPTSKDLTEGI